MRKRITLFVPLIVLTTLFFIGCKDDGKTTADGDITDTAHTDVVDSDTADADIIDGDTNDTVNV